MFGLLKKKTPFSKTTSNYNFYPKDHKHNYN